MHHARPLRVPLPLLLLLLLLACPALAQETLPDDDENYLDSVAVVVPDPLEGWNRMVFVFNDKLIEHALRPIRKGYEFVTPRFLRTGITNFFHNAAFPVRFVNNLLQGKGRAAGVEMSRFVLNSTAGLGGLFNVAESHKPVVPVSDEDFGQTLGVWGFGEGLYIVWPFLGPNTARDTAGLVTDYFLHPMTYLEPWELRLGAVSLDILNGLGEVLDLYDQLKGAAIEPYSSVRDAYVQYRRARIEK